jgi:hypothetical protein
MANKVGRAWKMERASVHKENKSRARSNKYSDNDSNERPAAGSRGRVWVGGYTRADGIHVSGHYRSAPK